MPSVDLFLQKYRALEQSLNPLHMSVLEFESTLSQDDSEALKLCRIMRNYIVHHPNGESFVTVSSAQCDFIDSIIITAKARYVTLKDFTVRVQPVVYGVDTLGTVVGRIVSSGRLWLPVVAPDDKRLLGVISCESLLKTVRSEIFKANKSSDILFEPTLNVLKSDMKKYNVSIQDIGKNADSFDKDSAIIVLRDRTYAGIIDWNK